MAGSAVLIAAGFLAAPAWGAARWKPADTQRFTQVREVRISPDGSHVAFEIERSDLAKNEDFSSISLALAAGGPVLALTEGDVHDHAPRFSPDGRQIAYLSGREGKMALWVMNANGGGKRRVCEIVESNERLQETGETFAWSPDGRWFVFAAGDSRARPQERDPLVITRLMYKANTDYTDNNRTQLWIVSAAGGEPRRLSDGTHVDHSPAWSPDSKRIVFVTDSGPDPDFQMNYDLFVADAATGTARQLTRTAGSEFRPAFSPDGNRIAYLATSRDWVTRDSIAEDFHLWVIPADGGTPRELNAALDRRTQAFAWAPDSRSLIFTAEDRGRVLPYRVPVEGGASQPLFDRDVWIGDPSVDAKAGRVAFAMSATTLPSELAVIDPGGGAPRVLTSLNAAALFALPVTDAETLWFDRGGARVEGWLLRPMGAEAGAKYPLVLFIHGGPHGQYGYSFSPEFQLYASEGYAVLYINPRGSTGYGQKVADACLENWGGVDYEDLMRGVDDVTARFDFIDSDRMVVTGGSYGGFMTNWVVTHTARFRAAVTREGMSNLATDSALSDAWDLESIEFGAPWKNYDKLMRWSPVAYITRAKTPTLVIQGERDNDVTMAEAQQMYQGLKLMKVDTALVIYPGEGHGFHEPKHRVDAQRRMLSWFGEHLKMPTAVDQSWK